MLIQSYILVQVDLSDKSVSISGGGLVNNIVIYWHNFTYTGVMFPPMDQNIGLMVYSIQCRFVFLIQFDLYCIINISTHKGVRLCRLSDESNNSRLENGNLSRGHHNLWHKDQTCISMGNSQLWMTQVQWICQYVVEKKNVGEVLNINSFLCVLQKMFTNHVLGLYCAK